MVQIGAGLILVFFVSAVPAIAMSAQGDHGIAVGFRVGESFSDDVESFNQYDFFIRRKLPWSWRPSGWSIDTSIEAAAGVLRGGGETGLVASLGPILAVSPSPYWSLSAGVSPAYMSESHYGRQDLGTRTQFISHVAINLRPSRTVTVSYRVQHMSNAGLSDHNPGLEVQMLEVSLWH